MSKPHLSYTPNGWECLQPGKIGAIGKTPREAYVAFVWANLRPVPDDAVRLPQRFA